MLGYILNTFTGYCVQKNGLPSYPVPPVGSEFDIFCSMSSNPSNFIVGIEIFLCCLKLSGTLWYLFCFVLGSTFKSSEIISK